MMEQQLNLLTNGVMLSLGLGNSGANYEYPFDLKQKMYIIVLCVMNESERELEEYLRRIEDRRRAHMVSETKQRRGK